LKINYRQKSVSLILFSRFAENLELSSADLRIIDTKIFKVILESIKELFRQVKSSEFYK
jgi:hypothetical protein